MRKVAIVTGGSSGIGFYTAKSLFEKGVVVYELSRRDCVESGVIHIKADVTKESDVILAVKTVFEKEGRIDILVNNAGIWPTAYVKEMTADAFRRTLEINLIAPFILCRNFVEQCTRLNKKGKIVNMVSQAAFHGSTTGHAHYAASKSGLVGFTISLAREVAAQGINVNAVAPV